MGAFSLTADADSFGAADEGFCPGVVLAVWLWAKTEHTKTRIGK
jgi:hypothetical protein